MDKKRQVTMRLHLWLEIENGMVFGLGRAQLLAGVERYGSLRKAAQELGMSYRAAWGKIKKTEELVGDKLLVKTSSRRGGYSLTELGRQLMNSYFTWFKEVEEIALNRAKELFPWPIELVKEVEEKNELSRQFL